MNCFYLLLQFYNFLQPLMVCLSYNSMNMNMKPLAKKIEADVLQWSAKLADSVQVYKIVNIMHTNVWCFVSELWKVSSCLIADGVVFQQGRIGRQTVKVSQAGTTTADEEEENSNNNNEEFDGNDCHDAVNVTDGSF